MTFLSRSEVLALHHRLVDLHGGSHGLRDEGLLTSALAQPEATFEGEYLHPTIEEMAAAYAFHLVKNHPFVDGNKRIALATMLTFLELNGRPLLVEAELLYVTVMALADGRLDENGLGTWLRDALVPRRTGVCRTG